MINFTKLYLPTMFHTHNPSLRILKREIQTQKSFKGDNIHKPSLCLKNTHAKF